MKPQVPWLERGCWEGPHSTCHGRAKLGIVAELCKPLQDLSHACPGIQGETMPPSIHIQHLRLQTPVKKGLKSCSKSQVSGSRLSSLLPD